MKCMRCLSENVLIQNEQISAKTKGSLFRTLLNIVLVFCTAGLWLIVLLCGRRKSKTKYKYKKVCICQNCGNSWYIN